MGWDAFILRLRDIKENRENLFEKVLGITAHEFEVLYARFNDFPDKTRKLRNNNEKLYAILLYKKWHLEPVKIGKMILESPNALRDGATFVRNMESKLNNALDSKVGGIDKLKKKINNLHYAASSQSINISSLDVLLDEASKIMDAVSTPVLKIQVMPPQLKPKLSFMKKLGLSLILSENENTLNLPAQSQIKENAQDFGMPLETLETTETGDVRLAESGKVETILENTTGILNIAKPLLFSEASHHHNLCPSNVKKGSNKLIEKVVAMQAPIIISYRDENYGGGAFYDHYAVQCAIQRETRISLSINWSIVGLEATIKQSVVTLAFGNPSAKLEDRKVPVVQNMADDSEGLLLITGRARDTETKRREAHTQRTEHEKNLVQRALLRGQPILSICAGSWQVWEILGGRVKAVEGHNYGGGMPRIGGKGIGYNKQVHKVEIKSDTLLLQAMGYRPGASLKERCPPVNSVHWKAPDPLYAPHYVRIAAIAIRDDIIAPNSRQGDIMAVEDGTVEAFETCYGAPILGVQWHPEAYNATRSYNTIALENLQPDKQRNLLLFMAKAGDSYALKRKMLKELKTVIQNKVP